MLKKSNNNFTNATEATQIWAIYPYKVVLIIPQYSAGPTLPFVRSLYASPQHLSTQTDQYKKPSCFYLFASNHDEPVGFFYCAEESPGEWTSPVKAPFGGIEHTPDCPQEGIIFLLNCVLEFVSNSKGGRLKIKLPAPIYRGTDLNLYLQAGFCILNQTPNYHIPVSDTPFDQLINKQERRRLTKCRKSGYQAGISKMSAEDTFRFIETSRIAFGYTMSLTQNQLTKLMMVFPDHLLVFTVTIENQIVALSLTVRASDDILYNFLPASLPEYKNFSPMVLLHESIYSYCQNQGIPFLDLGVAWDDAGNFKQSLARFKKNLGAQESLKSTIVKYL